jgi:tRNA-2-methylthio-N6-dimethylallyladenosine synthase
LQEWQLKFNKKAIGKTMPVLFDKDGKFDGQIIGKTPYMQSVYVAGSADSLYGTIANVTISDAFLNSLTGSIII